MSVVACALLFFASTPLPTITVVETIGSDVAFDARAALEFVPSLSVTFASGDVRDALLACAGEIHCIRGAVPVEFPRALIAIIEKRHGAVSVAIELIDTTTPERLVRHFAEIDSTSSDPTPALARELRAALARAGHDTFGALRVDTHPEGAAILLDGRPSVPRVFLAPGPHALRVTATDYEPRDLSIVIAGGVEQTQSVELEPASNAGTTWLWIGAAATVVIAASIVAIAARASADDSGPVILCQRTPEGAPCGAR